MRLCRQPKRLQGLVEVSDQTGVALLTVLLVLAMASVAVVSMSTERQADIRRSENQLLASQRWEWVFNLEQQATALLRQDAKSGKIDGADDNWQRQTLSGRAGGLQASAGIEDLQGRINLNNLLRDGEVSEPDVARLRNLFKQLKLRPELVEAILDWIDADMEIRYPDGAEDEAYTRLRPAYRAANRPLVAVDELLLVQGIDLATYAALKPHVYVAEAYAPLNVNTASAEVLRSLAQDISADKAESMFRAQGKPFNKIEEFLQDEAVAALKIDKYGLTVSSEHFQLQGEIISPGGHFRFVSQLRRVDDGRVDVVKRQRLGLADD